MANDKNKNEEAEAAEEVAEPTPQDLRAIIFGADDIEEKVIPVPQWGVDVLIRAFDGDTRAALMERAFQLADGSSDRFNWISVYPLIVVKATFDPETRLPVFKDGDDAMLGKKSAAATELIAETVMELSGMTAKSKAALGNDSSTESDASTSS